VKICPQCGATARDEHAVCPVDGAALLALSTAMTLPAKATADPVCPSCGARTVGGETPCPECGERLDAARRSTFPGAGGARIGDFLLVRSHGEGDLLVQDAAGRSRLLVYGQRHVMDDEARALGGSSARFPSVVAEGYATEVGHFVALTANMSGATPLLDAKPSFAAGLALVRAVLDAAEEMETRGFAWEPAPTDLYVRPSGDVVAVRARGARRRREGERLNAKRVLEALADTLLPAPMTEGTPELVRLLIPRWNFSTRGTWTLEETMLARSAGSVAELCDPGLRRHHNEDAVAVREGEANGAPFTVLVVCDGVSSSTHAERASSIASEVARDAIAEFARTAGVAAEAAPFVKEAIRAAHVAICAADIDYGDGAPPGTTIVAALVRDRTLTVGWVGDSRAYWISESGSELCTTDHSWINDVITNGGLSVAEAMASPLAHALTKCLGPLENGAGAVHEVEADVRTKTLTGPGHLILCTDGLWNYFPTAKAIGDLVRGAGANADPSAIARFLVCRALAEGGGDNVSVAVHAVA
jgi:serine/threonine protein phosphatase PrpC